MPPRLATRPVRANDFSDVGKVGRRTGVTLPQGQLDINGLEEISHIFSSPRKPSPLHKSAKATPKTVSARKSLPPARSVSPRKSGISGTARRGRTADVFVQDKRIEITPDRPAVAGSQPNLTASLLASGARRFSPAKRSIEEPSKSISQTVESLKRASIPVEERIHVSIEAPHESTEVYEATNVDIQPAEIVGIEDEYVLPTIGDDDDRTSVASLREETPVAPPFDDEEADETFEPEKRPKHKSREPTIANSRRKRKSDAIDTEPEAGTEKEAEVASSPVAKRAKRISDQISKSKPTSSQSTRSKRISDQTSRPQRQASSPITAQVEKVAPKQRGRPPLKKKDNNLKLTDKQQDELNNIIEKVKPRPGQKKSLYVLRRETPADDGVTHTRSGRISVKPLAYWRNERCVYGDGSEGTGLQDDFRFPLNSIKEIIRTEEAGAIATGPKQSRRGRPKKKVSSSQTRKLRHSDVEEEEKEEEQSDQELQDDEEDPDAEDWEIERGIYKGSVAVWSPHHQAPIDEEEEMEIAYAPASIETREVKDSTFRYAKLLSSKFFGSGIVDLPSGGIKKAKNSRRMHMSFFVASGRVTVRVGALHGTENRFSIGKGGWWQVPRGNQYSMENELQKPARIFFSQACEPVPPGGDE